MLKKLKFGPKPTPVETTAPRSKEELNKEYSELCCKAGEVQYQVVALNAQLQDINNRISSLAKEAIEADKVAEEAKVKEALASQDPTSAG